MDPSPFAYNTFWNVMAGGFFGWLAGMASNQPNLQRCLALPSLKKAQMCVEYYTKIAYLFKKK
jgi:hypothetical protein